MVLLTVAGAGCQEPGHDGQPSTTAPTPSSPATASTAATVSAGASAATDGGTPDAAPAWSDDWPPSEPFQTDERVDLIIRGGQVIDGTGRPPVAASVVVDEDEIVHVGAVAPAVESHHEIDASGKVVAPGFIDAHSHGDPEAGNASFVAQGVTTIVVGQDGRSASNDHVRYWSNRLRKRDLRVNVATLVGHATVRGWAGVGVQHPPTDRQLDKMVRQVEREMDAGAFGLSTALEYTPGRFAELPELVAIAKPVAERGGVIMSHLRSEDDDAIDEALDELVAQGKGSGAHVHVAHIKIVYGQGAERAEALLRRMQQARNDGVELTADLYPYNASYTNISIVFPAFAKPPNSFQRVVRDKRDDLAAYLRQRIAKRGGPEATLFGSGPYQGKTLAQVAEEAGEPFEKILIDDIGPGGMSAAYFVMDDALQSRLLLDDHVMIGTDGAAHSRHPRGHGTFAKVIAKYVNDRKALRLEQAIHKMTWLTAQTVGLDALKRGKLRKGFKADLVVFDPAEVVDRATYEHPSRKAEGMHWVLVNGRSVWKAGKRTSTRPGRVLLRPRDQSP